VEELKFDAAGLIAAVAQDRWTGQVRMLAWMNREAVEATRESGYATFYSRSRQRLWRKGESSGNSLRVVEMLADCDGDTLLLLVEPAGPTCHTGRDTCFFRTVAAPDRLEERAAPGNPFLLELEREIAERATSTAEKSYTRSLLDGGVTKIGAKIEEEALELCAALRDESDDRVASEAADLVYHLLVGLRSRGVSVGRVIEVLAARAGRSGHAEKASRGTPRG
jgi:phosphoribosyl-ATP pyrophosphohydrolase/phosphoribosyl-AMP cyclohydrolase